VKYIFKAWYQYKFPDSIWIHDLLIRLDFNPKVEKDASDKFKQ